MNYCSNILLSPSSHICLPVQLILHLCKVCCNWSWNSSWVEIWIVAIQMNERALWECWHEKRGVERTEAAAWWDTEKLMDDGGWWVISYHSVTSLLPLWRAFIQEGLLFAVIHNCSFSPSLSPFAVSFSQCHTHTYSQSLIPSLRRSLTHALRHPLSPLLSFRVCECVCVCVCVHVGCPIQIDPPPN